METLETCPHREKMPKGTDFSERGTCRLSQAAS